MHLQAWKASSFGQSIWQPPPIGFMKINFDVAINSYFSVTAAVLSNTSGDIISAFTKKLLSTEVNKGESIAALTGIDLAILQGCNNLLIEGDSLVSILAINNQNLFTEWSIAPIIADIQLKLQHFQVWNATKVSRSANFRAHHLAKWAATNLVFGSIPNSSSILSSIRINSGKDPPI